MSDKIEIELLAGQRKRVRPKDITLLHRGPLTSLAHLTPQQGNLQEAWELLEGEQVSLSELADLLYGDATPVTIWAAWQVVVDGLWFCGEPMTIETVAVAEREAEEAKRQKKIDQEQAWQAFVKRVKQGCLLEEDHKPLAEVERLALGHIEKSHIMRELGFQERSEAAHRLLIKVGYWPASHNPFPQRFKVALGEPDIAVPSLPEESRQDLTHLQAFAIDDVESSDADDAVSIEGDRIWVHVADVAALVAVDSELDLEAQSRGANLYLPEHIIPMLPHALTSSLALGMAEFSPALSISFRLDASSKPVDIEIVPSTIRVTRCPYAEANLLLNEGPLSELYSLSQRFRARRLGAGAAQLDLPEVKVRVKEQRVEITSLPSLNSREMVTDLMLMAGEAVADFCQQNDIAIPYATQAAPGQLLKSKSLSAMFAFRRHFKPSRLQVAAEPHASLGLERYCRVTSPLRRYSDLLVHQQLRSFLRDGTALDESTVSKKINIANAAAVIVRKTERQSNTHWKLVYLQQNPKWCGEAVLVEHQGDRSIILIPELAMESKMRLKNAPELDELIQLTVREVDLVGGRGDFQVSKSGL
ncbi:MAG: RNB domain-containing ribonuclease [Candidatus Polarisedimenticolaceae bacterium]|nr:RNB domain-containing ribonuclease [Candidatus Polarisedimenticolaceae bacterium]